VDRPVGRPRPQEEGAAVSWRKLARGLLNLTVPLVLTLAGVFALVELGFRHFYQLIPLEVCASDPIVGNYFCQPYFLYDKPIRIAYRYQPGYRAEGWWDPANPHMANAADETAPTDRSDAFWYVFQTDEMGFPNGEYQWREGYDVVIAGDSFVIRTAPRTWIELLQEETGWEILTLGAPSWSTPNEVEAIKMYGLDKAPRWVVVMFFEGNDLFNAAQYLERQPTGLSWKEFDLRSVPIYRRLVAPHMFRYWLGRLRPAGEEAEPHYRYPVTASTEVGAIPMVLKDIHLLPLSADYQTLARSDEFNYVRGILVELNALCRAQDAQMVLVYVPSKEHVYWSRIWDPIDVNHILERTVTVELTGGDSGSLVWRPRYLSYDTFQENHNAQERLFEDMAAEEGILLLNLTPLLWQEAIQRGELYHYADPHWNQAGNQLVAEILAEFLANH
jgi:hypothetical protein